MTAAVLPTVCAWCERVRTTAGDWEKREAAARGSEATHGICPECLDEVQHAAALEAAAMVIHAGAEPLR